MPVVDELIKTSTSRERTEKARTVRVAQQQQPMHGEVQVPNKAALRLGMGVCLRSLAGFQQRYKRC